MFILDLFSGAGGLAEGFIAEGFVPVAHIEMDKDAIETLHTRVAYHYLKENRKLSKYIAYLKGRISREDLYAGLPQKINETIINETLSTETLPSIYEKIDRNMQQYGCENLDVLIGGPPCQTFSVISRRLKKHKNTRDKRNYLYKIYAQILGRYKPKFFVFENVPGFKTIDSGKTFERLKKLIEAEGYIVSVKELNASDFGVLQKRSRLIITGWRSDYQLNDITYNHLDYANATVNDLLRDLAPLQPGEEVDKYRKGPMPKYLKASNIRKNNGVPLTQHMCRYQNENDRSIYRIAAQLWKDEKKRLVYSDLPKHLITRSNPDTFTDKYKVVAGDLRFSHTIIAHIAKDGHYYIHPDEQQARSLSVREAARIQSFPDDFFFEGPRAKKYTQIGNAVPPLMAKQIAKGIKEALQDVKQVGFIQAKGEVVASVGGSINP